jgi:hypothetical protein
MKFELYYANLKPIKIIDMKTIKKNELTRFFKIIADNELSTRAKMEAYIREKQSKAAKIGFNTNEGTELLNEVELMFACHNYLSEIMKNSSVSMFLNGYLKK